MLLNNQRITLDFASKTPVKINNIMYKEGEKDRDGIVIEGLNVNIQETDSVVVYWLYSTQDLYIFVPTLGERISETEIKTLPPRGVLQKGEVGVEVIVLGADGSELKSQSGYIPVQASLIQEDYSGDADDDVSITMQLIAQATDLHQAAIALNAQMATAHQGRIDAENLREDKFDVHEANLIQKRDGVTSATSATNTAKDGANTAKTNADSKASLANSKAALAQTAATNANNAKTAADSSVASANAIKSQLETSTSSANTAKTNADSKASLANTKATLANDKATLANTAAINADNARNKAAAIPGEIVKARTGMDGVVNANLNERLRKDFEFIGKKLPVSKTSSGNGEIVFDGSLSGDVSGVVVEGQTLVNLLPEINSVNWSARYGGSIVGSTIVMDSTINASVDSYVKLDKMQQLKPNTNYTILVNITENNGSTNILCNGWNASAFVGNGFSINGTGLQVSKLTTISSLGSTHTGFMMFSVGGGDKKVVVDKIMLLEGDHTDKPLSFFEGLKSSELETVMTHGVNLVDMSRVKSGFIFDGDSIIESGGGSGWYDVLDVKTSKTTRLIFENKNGLFSHNYGIVKRDGTRVQYSTHNKNFLVVNRVYPFDKIVSYTLGTAGHKVAISIYEVTGSEPSTYIPYQSSTTTLPSPIKLRSLPNGVADTYDFDTQTLTRRCGEVVLNGSENWVSYSPPTPFVNNAGFALPVNYLNTSIVQSSSSDKFKHGAAPNVSSVDEEAYYMRGDVKTMYLKIAKSKLTTPDVAGFKAWLAQNPTTVVYELAEPTTEYIENNGQLRSYDYQTTIRADSIIPPGITATAPIDFTTSLATIANGISAVSNNDNAEYLSTEMSIIHDELNAIKATLAITPEA